MSEDPRERVSHVLRRLSMGAHPDVIPTLAGVDEAIGRALDLTSPPAQPVELEAPTDLDAGRDPSAIAAPIVWWLQRMTRPERMIEERLVWFWHDHFATSLAKVVQPYLMWQQHLTLREHAAGNFAELLRAIARDPAMLVYLDGVKSTATACNENFGRECLELFTMGREAGYTQDDVVAASRSFTGWVVNVPGRRGDSARAPWSALFVPSRHDRGTKSLLGSTGAFDMDGALDVILSHPATATFVVSKLYRELVGSSPDDATAARLAAEFRRDYAVMPLVEAIVADPGFLADAAWRAKVRTPVERVVAIAQAAGTDVDPTAFGGNGTARKRGPLTRALRTMSYLPFVPPNVAGYPKGTRLLGPSNLVHSFDLLHALAAPPADFGDTDALCARFGVFDVSDETRAAIDASDDPARRFALAAASPEFALA